MTLYPAQGMQPQTNGVHIFIGMLSADSNDAIVGLTRGLHDTMLLWLSDTPKEETPPHRPLL